MGVIDFLTWFSYSYSHDLISSSVVLVGFGNCLGCSCYCGAVLLIKHPAILPYLCQSCWLEILYLICYVQASPLSVGGRQVYIEEKRPMGRGRNFSARKLKFIFYIL